MSTQPDNPNPHVAAQLGLKNAERNWRAMIPFSREETLATLDKKIKMDKFPALQKQNPAKQPDL